MFTKVKLLSQVGFRIWIEDAYICSGPLKCAPKSVCCNIKSSFISIVTFLLKLVRLYGDEAEVRLNCDILACRSVLSIRQILCDSISHIIMSIVGIATILAVLIKAVSRTAATKPWGLGQGSPIHIPRRHCHETQPCLGSKIAIVLPMEGR